MGAIYMIPVSLIEIKSTPFSLFSIPAEAWGAIAFLGITCSFLATLFYFYALTGSESQKVGIYLYMIPPITAVIAHFYRGEFIGTNLIIGTLLVLSGVYLTERG
jgi:drug/metabolite transporter (DMT)-like permease